MHTQTHAHTATDTHRHTHIQAYTQIHTDTDTDKHTHMCTQTVMHNHNYPDDRLSSFATRWDIAMAATLRGSVTPIMALWLTKERNNA